MATIHFINNETVAEYERALFNELLRERGIDHRASRESWSALRHVAGAVQRAAAILGRHNDDAHE